MVEYKILTERDSRFSGNFDVDQLETALNSYAAEGWRIACGFPASSFWKSMKTELLIFLERDQTAD